MNRTFFLIGFSNLFNRSILTIFLALLLIGMNQPVNAQSEPTVGVILNDSLTSEGYTLLMPFSGKKTYLINNCGLVVHEWESSMSALVVYLLPDGRLLRGGPYVEILNWDGSVSWSYNIFSPTYSRHHDLEYLPNGNVLMSIWDIKDADYLKGLGFDTTNLRPDKTLWDEVILEVKPTGQTTGDIVWQWRASEHTIQDFNSNLSNYGSIEDHPELLNINFPLVGEEVPDDWLHFNSLDYNEALDQIMISCHTFSEIYIIDHSTSSSQSSGHIGGNANIGGDLMFRWGNPQAYDKGNSNDQRSWGQHDAQWILEGPYQDKILFFNNRLGSDSSTVEILELSYGVNEYLKNSDGLFLPDEPSKIIRPKSSFQSSFMSSCQLFKGTELISCESMKGRVTEYDVNEEILRWEYVLPVSTDSITSQGTSPGRNLMFRSVKFAPNYSAFNGKTLTPGLPIEKDPWDSDCFQNEEEEEEDTTSEDTTTAHLYSMDQLNRQMKVYPNPANEKLHISANTPLGKVSIYNMSGQLIQSIESESFDLEMDVQSFTPGIYLLERTRGETSSRQRIIVY